MSEFASVLRAWRDRVSPASVGLPAGRRAPGLRREELATLAGVSVDYIVRLEQGRAANPSPQMLGALAVALRLDEAERDHLFRVAGAAPPRRGVVSRHITPVCSALSTGSGTRRWRCSPRRTRSCDGTDCGRPSWATLRVRRHRSQRRLASLHVRDARRRVRRRACRGVRRRPRRRSTRGARSVSARRNSDAADRPVASRSPEFESRWSTARIAEHRSSKKVIRTKVGRIAVDCDVLAVPGSDLRVVVYTAAPGTEDADKLDLLRVTGLEAFRSR